MQTYFIISVMQISAGMKKGHFLLAREWGKRFQPAFEQFQQKCAAILRPEVRHTTRESVSAIRRKAEML